MISIQQQYLEKRFRVTPTLAHNNNQDGISISKQETLH